MYVPEVELKNPYFPMNLSDFYILPVFLLLGVTVNLYPKIKNAYMRRDTLIHIFQNNVKQIFL